MLLNLLYDYLSLANDNSYINLSRNHQLEHNNGMNKVFDIHVFFYPLLTSHCQCYGAWVILVQNQTNKPIVQCKLLTFYKLLSHIETDGCVIINKSTQKNDTFPPPAPCY